MAETLRSPNDLIHRIKEFGGLAAGWNSYRAPGISETAIKAALEVVYAAVRYSAPLPSAAPTAQGGVALTWYLPSIELQVLVDDESMDYSVSRPGNPKVIDQGSAPSDSYLERKLAEQLITRYLVK